MKRTTGIRTGEALLGVLLLLSVATRGAQDHQAKQPVAGKNSQQKTNQPASLSDDERADLFMARKSYGEAIETRYTDATFFFYMAKIYASAGNSSEAIQYLWRAMEEGFNDEKRILSDTDIQKISKGPAFVALIKNPQVAIKD